MDDKGSIYYSSQQKKRIYKINAANLQETTFTDYEDLDTDSSIGKTLLASSSRKFLYIRKNRNIVEIFKVGSSALNMKAIESKRIKVPGKISKMLNFYDRLLVITETGQAYIYNPDLENEHKIIANSFVVNLDTDPIHEFVTAACIDHSNEYLAIATQIFEEERIYNVLRVYRINTVKVFVLVSMTEIEGEIGNKDNYIKGLLMEITVNKCPLIMATRYGSPFEIFTFVLHRGGNLREYAGKFKLHNSNLFNFSY